MKDVLNRKMITLNSSIAKKQEVFNFIADKLIADKIVTNKEEFINGLNKREAQSVTGFENGIAIPHVQSDVVTKPQVYVLRTNEAVSDYESLDPNNKVKLIFLIAVPKNSESNEHLKILSTLSTKLMDKNLIDKLMKVDEDGIINLLLEEKEEKEISQENSKGLVLAVTACSTGIAHTYMTAEAIEKIAREKGYEVKVEKQGASGTEDKITKEDVARASFIILAHDVELEGTQRFNGLKYIDVKVAKPLHEPEKYFEMAKNSQKVFHADQEGSEDEESESLMSEMVKAMMTGISHMIPVVVAGGLLMGIAKLTALGMGGDELVNNLGAYLPIGSVPEGTTIASTPFIVFLAYLDSIGSLIMKFMYPIFAMYLAYSIGKKNALVPGFVAGIFAAGIHTSIWGFSTMPSGIMAPFVGTAAMPAVPSGFIGALILGFLAGYLVRALNKIKLHQNLIALRDMLIVPGVSILAVVIASLFIVEPIFGTFNLWIQQLLTTYQSSEYIYGTLVSAATAFDLGGPINKAAGAVAMPLAGDGTIAMTGRTLGIVIPPLGLGLATILDSIFRTNAFNEEERAVGTTSFILGFLAISEGAIPFMIQRPLLVISTNVIGAVLGTIVAITLGAQMWLPLPAIWGWPLVDGVGAYLIGLVVGVGFIAISNLVLRKMFPTKDSMAA